jgi:hypothetical protein
MSTRHALAIAAFATILSGSLCASVAADDGTAIARLADACTADHGYDPRRPGAVDETSLAENERAWRDCMYAGIRNTVMPRSPVPTEWQALIEADTEMTNAIVAGTMTRSQRAASLQVRLYGIRLAEAVDRDRRVKVARQQLELADEIETIRRSVPRFF